MNNFTPPPIPNRSRETRTLEEMRDKFKVPKTKVVIEEVEKKVLPKINTDVESLRKRFSKEKEPPEPGVDPIFEELGGSFRAKFRKRKAPAAIIPKEPSEEKEEFKKWMATTPGFIEALTQSDTGGGLEPTKLYDYQSALLLNPARNRYVNKSRQTGFSFVFASEGLAKAMLKTKHTSIFVSYNDEEAKEKIEYAKALYESMPLKWQKRRPLVVENKSRLDFKTKVGKTRLMSHGQRPPRGKGGGVDVYLDELAHYLFARQIYVAAGPIIVRSGGVLTVGSTPLGKGDVFWELGYSQKDDGSLAYPNFSRMHVYWWDCPEFCINVNKARKEAKYLNTDERVEVFGTDTLKIQRGMQDLDAFKQEFELEFIDEAISFFPYDLIRKCTNPAMIYYSNITDLINAIDKGKISTNLYAGFDVGRIKDKSEFYILEEIEGVQYTVYCETLEKVDFSDQKDYLRMMLNNLPIIRLGIDKTGMGINIAEDMEKDFPVRVEGVSFSNEFKEKCANNLKIRFETRTIWIPPVKDLVQQIHAIKKSVSSTGFVRYDVEKNKDHHGDKFWALGLASLMGTEAVQIVGNIPTAQKSGQTVMEVQRLFTTEENTNSTIIRIPIEGFSGGNIFDADGARIRIPFGA
jgi:phage FluMu gp28-like protein